VRVLEELDDDPARFGVGEELCDEFLFVQGVLRSFAQWLSSSQQLFSFRVPSNALSIF
jgi:hypothetical protein